jgi:monoamine oxidase
MPSFCSEVDVAVIGAGAGGIGAGRRLMQEGTVSLVVLEARDRVGGRLHTVDGGGFPLDRGGEWLHSADRNPLTGLAQELGFSVYPRLPEWTSRLQRSGETAAAEADWQRTREAHREAMRKAAAAPKDRTGASLLVPGGRWNQLLDATSSWGNGVELDQLSVKDYCRYEDSGINWRVREGYGRLLTALAEGLPVAHGAAVPRVEHGGGMIRLDTAQGTVSAARAIVTVPSSIIAQERLRFDPPLGDKVAAAAGLPLGLADKLFLRIEGEVSDFPSEAYLVGSTTRRETASYQIRPVGRPLIACFFGGRWARALEGEGMAGMAAFAVDELTRHLGSDVRRKLTPLAATAWEQDPWARGSYSYALPGHADDRAALAAPVDDRLFFAGEACSPNFFSTAHGAWISGTAAAEMALASLKRLGP